MHPQQNNFNLLYKNHCKLVYNVALTYLQNSEDAEEVTQDVFVKAYTALGNFKGETITF